MTFTKQRKNKLKDEKAFGCSKKKKKNFNDEKKKIQKTKNFRNRKRALFFTCKFKSLINKNKIK